MFEIKVLYDVGLAHKHQETYYVSLHTFKLELFHVCSLQHELDYSCSWPGVHTFENKKRFCEILPNKSLKEPPL